MEPRLIMGIVAITMGLISIGVFVYYFLAPKTESNIRNLMGSGGSSGARRGLGTPSEERARLRDDPTGAEYQRLKTLTKKTVVKKQKLTLEEKFFQAGMYSDEDKREFQRLRIIVPIVTTPVLAFAAFSFQPNIAIVGMVFGFLIGLQAPFTILDRRIKHQAEDIMYYLPLVIEQVAIGVSSSLDVGPCLSRIVSMADERDSHNSVTELIRHSQFHVKSGVSLEEALTEVGKKSGHTELKHAFMAMGQVAKHGGEITRQLQELADAVSNQRQTQIEAKIKKLELEATGPVALVFAGFLVILLIGFGVQIKKAFN